MPARKPATFSPHQVAVRYGVGINKVLRWIREGEILAVNVAEKVDQERPRWRISVAAVADFEARRSSTTGHTQLTESRGRNHAS